GTRLTDRLGRDDTHGLADVDLMPTGQIATVAVGADAVAWITADRSTHDHFIDPVEFEALDPLPVDPGTGRHQHFLGARLEDVTSNDTTQHTLAERLDHVAAFDVRRHVQTLFGTAVDLGHHQILGHDDQATRQVTGDRGLQCRIRQTITRTVSGHEVLQYVQAFTEVRGDRRLDDGAIRLGHQATHTGQLANLRSRTPRARVGHHVHRVERILLGFFTVTVDDLLFREVGHHRLGDFVVGLGPEVDHLVVLLALGYQAGRVLALDLLHFLGGRTDDVRLLIRDDEVVHADRHTGDGRVGETGVHQLVSEDDSVLQTHRAVAQVDQLRDRLLLHRLVDHVERHAFRNDLEQQRTADSGVDDAGVLGDAVVTPFDGLVDTHFHARMQRRLAGAEHAVDFLQIG